MIFIIKLAVTDIMVHNEFIEIIILGGDMVKPKKKQAKIAKRPSSKTKHPEYKSFKLSKDTEKFISFKIINYSYKNR